MEEDVVNNPEGEQAPAGESPDAGPAPEEACSKKVYDELYGKYLRLTADFDNYRKRAAREKEEHRAFANEKLVSDLLPVLDHLELAVKHARESDSLEALIEGVELVVRQFKGVLEQFGVKAIEAVGQPFDPRLHEALMHVESTEHDENTVTAEHQKGYLMSGRTLRPSRVSVSRKADKEEPGPGGNGQGNRH